MQFFILSGISAVFALIFGIKLLQDMIADGEIAYFNVFALLFSVLCMIAGIWKISAMGG